MLEMREEKKKKRSKKLAFYCRGTVMQGWLAGGTGLDFSCMTSPERPSNRAAGSGKLIPVVDLPRPDRTVWDVAATLNHRHTEDTSHLTTLHNQASMKASRSWHRAAERLHSQYR